MSRTPSVYCDALDTPLQEPAEEPSHVSSPSNSSHTLLRPRARPLAELLPEANVDPIEQDVEVEGATVGNGGDNEAEDGQGLVEDGDIDLSEDEETEAARLRNSMDVDEESHLDTDVVMQVDSAASPNPRTQHTVSIFASSSPSTERRSISSSAQHGQSTSSSQPESHGSSSASVSGPSTAGKTVSVPFVDEKAQSELRRKIMDIQRDPTISFADKAGMIQKLMSSKWQGSQRSSEHPSDESGEATLDDLKKTYYNDEQKQLGCKHYMRGCKLKANCCGKWFNCRFCHDDTSDHAIVRSETKTMMCMHCQTIQIASQNCSSCKASLAVYYCDICKLWDDDARKNIYHCEDCGICRIGQGLGQDYFHCKKCNVCMNIQLQDNHKCIERNLECDCPICGEYMFTSTTTVIFMPCGHCIHSRCHEDYIKTSYQCPTCWKSLGDMSAYYAKIDSLLAEQTMPPEYANIFSIVLCNDCEVKSEAPYHFLYHKCDKCKGYNTKVLETFKRVMDGQVQMVENATAAGAAAAVPENNISGSSNGLAGPSSAAGGAVLGAGAGSSSSAGAGTTSIHLAGVGLPRSPLMDENASGDMSMAGISGNSAP